ncbi:MAG TPA: helix-turn-helix transcriptional regulator [Jatrophihabitans sp.]|nr:helix-turn-helix transcriptional regulator [Jatrophihabitans sp.]
MLEPMDREQLAGFLRGRRDRLRPGEVGLPEGIRRRTPGLRREEVAALAGMSTDYYARLEQGRGPRPSGQLLAALARALRLDRDESDHLFYLAGQNPPTARPASAAVSPGMLWLLDRLPKDPAFVVSDTAEVLVQNQMSRLVQGPLTGEDGRPVNFTLRWFTDPDARRRFPVEDHSKLSRTHVADLRATAARRRGQADIDALVERLRRASGEFRELWDQHEVAVRRRDEKRIIHPEVGLLDLWCEKLYDADSYQTLVLLFPRPGSDAADKLELLRVIGTQSFTG